MPKSGALFDLVKLNSINKEYISVMSHEEFYQAGMKWAGEYDKELFILMEKYPALTKSAMNIERLSEKDPKRFIKISDIKNQLLPFYPESYTELRKNCPAFPEHITHDILAKFLRGYAEAYNPNLSKDEWFTALKEF
jgi:glutamyl-tRNA synthetase